MGEQVVRAFLLLYPRRFRESYREAVLDAFRQERAGLRRVGRLVFWRRIVRDLVLTGMRARVTEVARRLRSLFAAGSRAAGSDRGESPRGGSRTGAGSHRRGRGRRRAGASSGAHGGGPTGPLGGGSLGMDLRQAARGLARRPGVTAVAALTLGLGMGLTTTMFGVADAILFRGLPEDDGGTIVSVRRYRPRRGPDFRASSTVHDFLDLRARQTTLDGLAAWSGHQARLSDGSGRPDVLVGASLTVNAFDLLGVDAALGRTFEPSDGAPDAEPVAVISHGLWRERFGSDPEIVGETVRVDGVQTRIVGVAPRGFGFPSNVRIWVPLKLDRAGVARGEGDRMWPFGRLRDGVTLAEAGAEFDLLARQLADEYPETDGELAMLVDTWASDYLQSMGRQALWLAIGSAGLVLLLACLNVSNLLLARAVANRRQLAVRAALGAGRWRIVRLVLLDAVLIAALGTVAGLGIAWLGIGWFENVLELMPGGAPWYVDVSIHPRVLLFSMAVLASSAVVASVIPAHQISRTSVREGLADSSGRASSLRIGRTSRLLVFVQVVIACVLLAGAGLLGRSVVNVRSLELGMEPDSLFTGRVSLPETDYPTPEARAGLWRDLLGELRANPALGPVALTDDLPIIGGRTTAFEVVGAEGDVERPPRARLATVSPGFFEALGVGLVRGRELEAADDATAPPVALVDTSFVERRLGDEPPLGRRLRLLSGSGEETTVTIVGVVPQTYALFPTLPLPGNEAIFVPIAQSPPARAFVLARQADDPSRATPLVRRVVASVDRDLPIERPGSLRQQIYDQNSFVETFGTIFGGLGLATLVLAAVGLYSVTSFTVRQRTREVGIRVALGAAPSRVARMVLAQGIRRIALGLGVGMLAALGFGQLLARMLFRVQPTDPLVYVGIAATLTASGVLATWLPARRASRVDPLIAMRAE